MGNCRRLPCISELGRHGSSVGSDFRNASDAISISAMARANASEPIGASEAIEGAIAFPLFFMKPPGKNSVLAGLASMSCRTATDVPSRRDAVCRMPYDCAFSTSRKPRAFLFSTANRPNQSFGIQ